MHESNNLKLPSRSRTLSVVYTSVWNDIFALNFELKEFKFNLSSNSKQVTYSPGQQDITALGTQVCIINRETSAIDYQILIKASPLYILCYMWKVLTNGVHTYNAEVVRVNQIS